MNELGQRIHDVICDLPLMYGNDIKKKKAQEMAYEQFRGKIVDIFCAESCLSVGERKDLINGVVDKIKEKILDLDRYCLKHSGEIKKVGMPWCEVKAGKGKSEKSRRCKVNVLKGTGSPEYIDEWEAGTSSFYAPASMILERGGKKYLQEWFVLKKLESNSQKTGLKMILASGVCWPGADEYAKQLFSILPNEKEIEQAIEDKRINDAKLKQQRQEEEALRKIREEERRKSAEKAAKEAEERAKKNSAAKLARRAKQEQVHNVNVLVKWSEMRGDKVRRGEYELENVSLYYVGKTKVDIVESDGEETRKNRTNVIII